MRNSFVISVLASLVFMIISCQKVEKPEGHGSEAGLSECGESFRLEEGDIIFQTSMSSQSRAVQLATHSRYSHVGIVYVGKGGPHVYEAAEKVKFTPIREWINTGEKGGFVIKRLKKHDSLSPDILKKMKSAGDKFRGKNYDLYFEWDDSRIYCSELVYKVYRAGGIELGELQTIKDFDLTHSAVRKKMKERFGDKIPYDETVISPDAIFNDEKLIEICSSY
jgi:hypothetical protein